MTEKPVFGKVLIQVPRAKRHARVGVAQETLAFPKPFDPAEQSLQPKFGQNELGNEPLSYSAAIEHWKKRYREAVLDTGMDPEIALIMYQTFLYGEIGEDINPYIRGLKSRIEKQEELDEREEAFYIYPDFFRKKLLSPKLRAEGLLRYGLLALRMDRIFPDREAEFNSVGFDLLEAAETASPRNPKYKLALWREYERKMEERRIRDKKGKETIKPAEYQILNRYNSPQVYESFTINDYRTQIRIWGNLLDQFAERGKLNWPLFRAEYTRLVEVAKKIRDIRNYEGNKIKYRPIDYDEMIKNKAPEAILKGLAALYTAPRGKEKACEPKGIRLLAIAATLPPPDTIYKPPQPWRAFVISVIIWELYRLLGTIPTVGKRVAKIIEFQDSMLHQEGEIPKELREFKDQYPDSRGKKSDDPLDEIPR